VVVVEVAVVIEIVVAVIDVVEVEVQDVEVAFVNNTEATSHAFQYSSYSSIVLHVIPMISITMSMLHSLQEASSRP
jgi:hypothetical protein